MRILLLLVTLAVALEGVSCAPHPRPDTIVAPITPALYSPPLSYSYSSFVSHPTAGLYTPYAYPYSYADNNQRLYQLACYVLPYYESPYLTLLCLLGIALGNRIEQPANEQYLAYGYPYYVI